MTGDEIRKVTLDSMSKVLGFSKEVLENSMDKDLIKDFKATSQQFFPVIAALEDEFDLELQYQDFRRNGRTLNEVIKYVTQIYTDTYGE